MSKQRLSFDRNPVTKPLVDDKINPISEWCAAERGRKAAFVMAFKRAAQPEIVSRNLIEGWLRADDSTRFQPSLGYGLLLIQVATAMGIYTKTNSK